MNWLEKGCVRAAPAFKQRSPKQKQIDEMLRQGHLSHKSARRLFKAQNLSSVDLAATEERNLDALETTSKQTPNYRFRPSVLIPFAACASTAFGKALSAASPQLANSYAAGVKLAIGDYYNDQIREIYAEFGDDPEAGQLKELFKTLRDAELDDVEALFPSIEAAKQNSVAQYAKTITQMILSPATYV